MCIVTIPYLNRINHLFQNGRALLKCQIFLPPTGPYIHPQTTSNIKKIKCIILFTTGLAKTN
jgi:hypothetical protein